MSPPPPTIIRSFHQDAVALERQIDYMAEQIHKVETTMIDPQEFGELKAEMTAQRRDLDRLAKAVEALAVEMASVKDTLSTAQGGWRMLMAVGGAGASLGAGISWLGQHLRFN